MKNENVVKKILMKALIGFPIGVTLLIMAYASIYFISGNDVFNSELFQLHNIKTLITQTIYVGISGYILALNLYIISHLFKLENFLMKTQPYKYTFTFSISSFVIIFLLLFTLENAQTFSKNICILNATIMIIVIALCFLAFFIKTTIEKLLIKKINQKIKERNNK